MAELVTVTDKARRLRWGIAAIYENRHEGSGARARVGAMAHAVRWCERRTDPGEEWNGETWHRDYIAEQERRRCVECKRIRGRAATAGGLCRACTCEACGGPIIAGSVIGRRCAGCLPF